MHSLRLKRGFLLNLLLCVAGLLAYSTLFLVFAILVQAATVIIDLLGLGVGGG